MGGGSDGSEGEEEKDGEEGGGEGGGEGEEEGEEEGGGGRIIEVKWSVPGGFEVADEPEALDDSIVGKTIYMRWEKYGWQLGKILEKLTNRTPRLVLKFNYRIVWSDGSKGPAKLGVDNYGHGADARYDSWVILQQKS